MHPQFLLPALNFVIPALEVPQLAPYAAKALKNICDTCRESLVEAIDAFMTVFANVEKAIDPSIKGSVVYSIATVIQTLPVERSIGPLVVSAILYSFQAYKSPPKSRSFNCYFVSIVGLTRRYLYAIKRLYGDQETEARGRKQRGSQDPSDSCKWRD